MRFDSVRLEVSGWGEPLPGMRVSKAGRSTYVTAGRVLGEFHRGGKSGKLMVIKEWVTTSDHDLPKALPGPHFMG